MDNRILAVGAHPDDIELGCAGSLAKHLESGDKVYALVLTRGESGNHSSNQEECYNSLKSLGLKNNDIIFGDFRDGYLQDTRDTVNFIEEKIKELEINRVYTNSPNDRHQDHRNCSNSVSSAARRLKEVLLFQVPSTKSSFTPHYFVELSDNHIVKKLECLSFYKSQIEKKTFTLEHIKSIARTYGTMERLEFAEAFEVNHILRGGQYV